MATIYSDINDNRKVRLGYREALKVPFNVGDWTKIRVGIGLYFDNLIQGDDTVTAFGNRDRIYIGLKKYNELFPADNSSEYFLGIATSGAQSYWTMPYFGFPSWTTGTVTTKGVHHPDGTREGTSGFSPQGTTGTDPYYNISNYLCSLVVFEWEIINKGLSNQQIIGKWGNINMANISRANCKFVMFDSSTVLSSLGTMNFNLAGVPYALPDSFFLYNPTPIYKMTAHAFVVERMS